MSFNFSNLFQFSLFHFRRFVQAFSSIELVSSVRNQLADAVCCVWFRPMS